MNYIIFFNDSCDTNKIRISEEQRNFLRWLDDNDYLESWKEECEGSIDIYAEDDEIIDLTR